MTSHSTIMVKKFGGTSVGSIERIEAVAARIAKNVANGEHPVIVASAMSGETNRLVQLAYDVNPTYRGPAYDMLLASGEQVSISLLAMSLEKHGLKAQSYLAHQLGIKTNSIFSKAKIQSIDSDKLKSIINEGIIPVIAGFQGVTDGDRITTLGRGGSDTTAIAIAAALGAKTCEIYTDVPKVFTADPRLIPKAKEIGSLDFKEMMEMASLGSKVLHFRCVELAAKFNIKIHLRSTFEEREGTWIMHKEQSMENPVVSSVTHDPSTCVIKLFPAPFGSKFLAGLFEKLSESGCVVDIITQSHNDQGQRLAFSVREEDRIKAAEVAGELVKDGDIEVLDNLAKISVIGVGMANNPGVAARFFRTLDTTGAKVHLVTTSDIKISAVVDKSSLDKVAIALHTEFGLDKASV